MVSNLYDLNSYQVPGVYLAEGTYGQIPQGIASHNAVYWLGYSSQAGAPIDVPTFCQSPTDFVTVFGASLSLAAVNLFFKQLPGNGIWFINVRPRSTRSLTIGTVTVGAVYSVTLGGFLVSYTAVTGDDEAKILAGLAQAVNQSANHLATLIGSTLRLQDSTTTVVGSANVTIGAVVASPAYPRVQDALDSLDVAIADADLPQGFLIAPEFFQSATTLADHTALAQGLEAKAADPRFNLVAIADCRETTATQLTGSGAVNLALQERAQLSSPKGHLVYYFPYFKDLNETLVPPSPVVAGVALRRYRSEGYRQPVAGIKYPVYGVSDPSFPVTDNIQAQLNPKGINCMRRIRDKGVVIFGARTLSTSPFYTFMTTRVIFNVLGRSIDNALDELVFSSIDGQGALFGQVKATCIGICERLRIAGALFGASPQDAYLVVCDLSNNPALDLDNGKLAVDVYAKPSPTLEIVGVRLFRTALGQSLTEDIVYQQGN